VRKLGGALILALGWGCAAPSGEEDRAWAEHLAELDRLEEPADLGRMPHPIDIPPLWWMPADFHEFWHSRFTGQFPDRPAWSAERRLRRSFTERRWFGERAFDVEPTPPETLPHLLSFAEDRDPAARALVCHLLGSFPNFARGGDPSGLVRDALHARLRDGDDVVRAAAAWALGQAEDVDPSSLAPLPALLDDRSAWARMNAAWTLAGRRDAPRVIPVLRDTLAAPEYWIRSRTLRSAARMGMGAAELSPQIFELLKDPSPNVRGNAYGALKATRPELLSTPEAEAIRREIEAGSVAPAVTPPK
jgi:hypothetical protein